jgi:membrane protein YdbS with pleckstrin-like domain
MTAGTALGSILPGEWLHPSPKLATLRRVELLVGVLVVLLGAGPALLFTGHALAAGVVTVGMVAVEWLGDVLLQRRVRAWAFCEREDDLLVRRGLLVSRLSLVPYGRMQFVDVVAGPFERSLGLATLRLHTAAAASDARIPGLPRAEAERLRDQLSAVGTARAAGL